MRAGLLSEKETIRLINENFVTTWTLIDDIKNYAGKGDRLADTLADNWEYPLDLMFLTAQGEFVSKVNTYRDFPSAHEDVGHPNHFLGAPSHAEIFLARVNEFLDRSGGVQAPPIQGVPKAQATPSRAR